MYICGVFGLRYFILKSLQINKKYPNSIFFFNLTLLCPALKGKSRHAFSDVV